MDALIDAGGVGLPGPLAARGLAWIWPVHKAVCGALRLTWPNVENIPAAPTVGGWHHETTVIPLA
jgi:hypothetical protein